MDLSTWVIVVTGVGAVAAVALGLRSPAEAAALPPPPPVDPSANERYGLFDPLGDPATGEAGPNHEGLAEAPGDVRRPKELRPPSRPGTDRKPGWDKTGVRDQVIGTALLLVAPVLLIPGVPAPLPVALGWAGLAAAAATFFLQRGSARRRGVAVERSAVRSVQLPDGWTAESNLAVAGHGDIDLLITDPVGVLYVVEIKANEKVQVRKSWMSSKVELLGADGKKLPKDPVQQVLALAGIVRGHPVVWFPKSRGTAVMRVGTPAVLVVQGPWKYVRKAIGAGGGWLW